MKDDKRPLSGIRILDLTTHAAGPGAARILADQGAEVIKVEPLEGDVWRAQAQMLGFPIEDTETPCFDMLNGNKKFLAVDLKSEQGKEIFHRALESADVLITSYRDSALKKLGISYEQLHEKYPRLVYGHVKGYGEKGPEAERPGYDMVTYFARSGIMIDTVAEGQLPLLNIGGIGDHPTSVALAQGVTAAIIRQIRTGRGDKVVVSLYHAAVWAASTLILSTQYGAKYPLCYEEPTFSPVVHPYRCADGTWVIMMLVDLNKYWAAFCNTIDRPDLIANPKFNNMKNIKKNQPELVGILSRVIGEKPYQEWAERWRPNDIPYEVVSHMRDVPFDETARLNDFVQPVSYPSGKTAYMPTSPMQFREMGTPPLKTTVGIGSETFEILQELGYSGEEIANMQEENIVKCR